MITQLDLVYRAWRYRLKLDPAEIRYLLAHVSRGDVVVDIGAHKGAYTYWLRKRVGKEGKVFSFEPQTGLSDYLKKVVNSLSWDNVTVENLGLSSREGELILSVPGTSPSPGASFEEKFSENDVTQKHKVEVVTLDEYISASCPNERVKFIKCDVEGHELEVFRGAENILKEYRPILMFECEQRHHVIGSIYEVFKYLEELGYTGYFFSRGEIRPIKEFSVEDHQVQGKKPYINNFLFK